MAVDLERRNNACGMKKESTRQFNKVDWEQV